jgi:hypothetical protein
MLVADIFFSKEELASVSSDGLVSGLLLGSCQLTARALGKTPTGELIEYSRDTVNVHVVYLTSIRYPYPSNQCSGSMTFWCGSGSGSMPLTNGSGSFYFHH